MVGFNVDIPEELHREFKKRCIDLGVFMEDRVLQLIQKDIKKKGEQHG